MICDSRIKNLQIKLVSIRCKGQVCFSCLLFYFLQFKMFWWPFVIWVIQGQNKCYTNSVKVLAQQTFRRKFYEEKILVIFILYLIMSIFLYPLRESIWYHLFYTIAYMIAVVIYFALTKKKGAKKWKLFLLKNGTSSLRDCS